MQPDVSFIVPAFRAAGTVRRAIESALASAAVDLEVVVADDCSPDETAAIVAGIGDPRVRLLRRTENGGPGAARNTALAAANGRYVAILDADDTVRPERARRLVDRLEASGAAAILDGVEVVEANGSRRPMFDAGELTGLGTVDLPGYMTGNVLFSAAFNLGYLKPVVRRSFLVEHAVVYPEDLRIGEDYLFMAEILARGAECLVEPTVGYAYGITAGSVSRELRLDHIRRMRAADERFERAHALDAQARTALLVRRRAFADAEAFLSMVEALKTRDPAAFAREAARRPAALRHFRMPLSKRLSRFLPFFAARKPRMAQTRS